MGIAYVILTVSSKSGTEPDLAGVDYGVATYAIATVPLLSMPESFA
jgi:hypothetical protein